MWSMSEEGEMKDSQVPRLPDYIRPYLEMKEERKDEQKEERGAEGRELNLTLLPAIQKSRSLTMKYIRENVRERNFLKFLVVKLTELIQICTI